LHLAKSRCNSQHDPHGSVALKAIVVQFGHRRDAQMTTPIVRDPIYRRRRFDAEIIELCVRWYITYRLSYRDLVAMMAELRRSAGTVLQVRPPSQPFLVAAPDSRPVRSGPQVVRERFLCRRPGVSETKPPPLSEIARRSLPSAVLAAMRIVPDLSLRSRP
jgi:hypothetical protein